MSKKIVPLSQLSNLAEVQADASKMVVVTHTEECRHVAEQMLTDQCICVCWEGESPAMTDWTPLIDRKVTVIPDWSKEGRQASEYILDQIAGESTWCCELDKAEGNSTLLDFVSKFGLQKTKQFVRNALRKVPPRDEAGFLPPKHIDIPHEYVDIIDYATENDKFRVIGTLGLYVVINHACSGVVTVPMRQLLKKDVLYSLAGREDWMRFTDGQNMTTAYAEEIGDRICEKARELGEFDSRKLTGFGAKRYNGNFYFNIGRQVMLSDGTTTSLYENDIPLSFTHSSHSISLVRDESGEGKECLNRLANTLKEYRFSTPEDVMTFGGWLVSALMCGALDRRPHIWICARSIGGKSFLLERVAMKLYGNACMMMKLGTEAGLRNFIRSDAIPVLIDEAEESERDLPGLIKLLRAASDEQGIYIKSSNHGDALTSHLRVSACIASVQYPMLKRADQSRIRVINLGGDELPNEDFKKLSAKISALLTEGRAMKMRSHILRSHRELFRYIADFETKYTNVDTREAQSLAILSAGWSVLSGENELINNKNTQELGDLIQQDDDRKLLRGLLDIQISQVPVWRNDREVQTTMSLGDMVFYQPREDFHIDKEKATIKAMKGRASQYGIAFTKRELRIHTGNDALRKLVERNLDWGSIDMAQSLMRINGTRKERVKIGRNTCWSVMLPEEVLLECGIEPTKETEIRNKI